MVSVSAYGQLNTILAYEMVQRDTIRYLNIPERSENSIGGAEFVRKVTGLSRADREKAIVLKGGGFAY